jgi:hypothetical protein
MPTQVGMHAFARANEGVDRRPTPAMTMKRAR